MSAILDNLNSQKSRKVYRFSVSYYPEPHSKQYSISKLCAVSQSESRHFHEAYETRGIYSTVSDPRHLQTSADSGECELVIH